jgi:GGDEF domain-containing protein
MVTRRVREALAVPIHVGGAVVEVRTSVGSALSPGSDPPGALLNLADRAMAREKAARRATGSGAGHA